MNDDLAKTEAQLEREVHAHVALADAPYAHALSRWNYKPGVEFTAHVVAGGPNVVILKLSTTAHNSRRGDHQPRPFTVTRPIAAGLTDEQVRDELVALVEWWELHESREWARWDGVLIEDPHDEHGNAIGQYDTVYPLARVAHLVASGLRDLSGAEALRALAEGEMQT